MPKKSGATVTIRGFYMTSTTGDSGGQIPEEVAEFLVESYENLDRLDQDLVTLESDPQNHPTLSSIFRTIHTIKGTCGFLGFEKLEKVAHVGENLLSKLRDGVFVVNPSITTALLATVDAVREILSEIESTNEEGNGDYSALIATLSRLAAGEEVVDTPQVVVEEVAPVEPEASTEPETIQTGASAFVFQRKAPIPQSTAVVSESETPTVVEASTPPAEESVEVAEATQTPREEVGAVAEAKGDHDKEKAPSGSSVSDANIRVDVGLLDKLMNLVGELVLARNQILQYTTSQTDSSFVAASQRLNLITSELQEGVMKTRMQPIGNVWSKFPRVVRDLALSVGKQVAIEFEGRETELDRTIIESIKDPLTHLVRNSVDHGIEPPEVREKIGKAREGRLVLRAYHEGGHVNIEISDDGSGINPDKIRANAIKKGLFRADQLDKMSEREIVNLIFAPGFSTAEKITNVSGRGVGMDVVKTNIEKIGGTIDISTNLGEGTTFKIKIPLTLAIIPALVVAAGGQRYAIPQVSLVELVRLEKDQAATDIDSVYGAPVCRLRGNLLPLVYLCDLMGTSTAKVDDDAVNIVVLQADERQFGLVVDSVVDTEEIVVKPLGKQVKNVDVYAGATIMGDGKVALILDVMGIAQRSSVISEVRDRKLKELSTNNDSENVERQTLLLLGVGDNYRVAVPLASVDRLEEFSPDVLEWAGDNQVVQYRDSIMPLIWLSSTLGVPAASDPDAASIQVVVHSGHGRRVGVVVDRILDIVSVAMNLEKVSIKSQIMGSTVVNNRVTDIVNIDEIVQDALVSFIDATEYALSSYGG
ncbi:MAG: chemotaxis protein CheA [Actinomycetota bacterium]|nr:chemotaxis protein CheA [Actinomycetota bacterium]